MNDLQALCRACGMCCDGTLFGRGQLDADEIVAAKTHRLRVVRSASGSASFEQSCSAFTARGCSIYDERPRSCRRFVCRLHERARTGGGSLDEHLRRIERARELLGHLERSGVVDPELTKLLDEDFARA